MKIRGGAPIRFVAASLLGAALVLAAPVAAFATPTTPNKASPTTTTTTKPSKNAQAFAKLVIKPSSVGHVNVKIAGGSTFKPAKDGQSLHVGDTVQTDATGQAEIDYADTAWTRLDVNTTFTIKKLTDSQGNRQVEGSLDVGRTYNRTAALTQSQTFQQDGGGATAAVAGTAFVVTCTSATNCTFTAVIDNINLTGTGGQTKTLNPLDECVDSNGALCGTTTRLTPDELALIQWIQTNVYLDLVDHGIGTGVFQPFTATVVVNNGVVQSVTVSAATTSTTTPPTPPPNNPGPSPACQMAPTTPPIVFDGSPGTGAPPSTLGSCSMAAFAPDTRPLGTAVSSVATPVGGSVTFSVPLVHQRVGQGWATWSNHYTGDVYVITNTSPVTLTLPSNTFAFYFYAEPDIFNLFTVTATAQDGTSSGAVSVQGDSGAKYFGFYTTLSSNPILSVAVSTTDTTGMAIGEFGIDPPASSSTTATMPTQTTPTTSSTTTPTTTPTSTPTTSSTTTP